MMLEKLSQMVVAARAGDWKTALRLDGEVVAEIAGYLPDIRPTVEFAPVSYLSFGGILLYLEDTAGSTPEQSASVARMAKLLPLLLELARRLLEGRS